MNTRTILIAGSLSLLTLSPLQASTAPLEAPAAIQTEKMRAKTQGVKAEDLKTVQKPAPVEESTTKAEPAQMDRNVTMSVGTLIVILLLIIILL